MNGRPYSYVLLDVFTHQPLEGNQLAVFTDARGLSDARDAGARQGNKSLRDYLHSSSRRKGGAHTRACGCVSLPRRRNSPLPDIQRWEPPGVCGSSMEETWWSWS